MAKILERLSLNYLRLSDLTQAESLCKQALQIAQNQGDQQAEAQYQNTLARIYRLNDEYERAFHHANLSIDLARSMNDRYQEQISLGNLGRTFIDASDFEAASSNLEEALSIAREVDSKRHELDHLKSLGLSYFFLGKWNESLQCQESAMKIVKELNYRQLEAFVYSSFAHVEFQLNQVDKAFHSYQKSIDLFQNMGNLSAELTQRNNQLNCYIAYGNFQEALTVVNHNLTLSQNHEYVSLVSQSLGYKGTILRYLGDFDTALTIHFEALAVAKDYDSTWDCAVWNKELGIDYLVLGEMDKAVSHYETALKLLQKMNGLPWQVMLLAYLAVAHEAQGAEPQLESVSTRLRKLANSAQLVPYGCRILKEQGDMFTHVGMNDFASLCYKRMNWLSANGG